MKLDKEAPTALSIIYFEVENLDEMYEKLKDHGVQFISEPKKQGWGGKTAIMLDPTRTSLFSHKCNQQNTA